MHEKGAKRPVAARPSGILLACGSALWLYDKRWPDLVHPFASAIDTPLPVPPRSTHLMLIKAPWVEPK